MEALSPRDANIQVRKQQIIQKTKPSAKLASAKEKDHPPPPPAEVIEPPSFDRKDGAVYETGKSLGKGGFAICYEGRHRETKQIYALKVVKSHMPQKKMEQKFQTELQIHSKMAHPNIVKFHRAFSFHQSTYIILELCPNGSLMDMVKKRKYVTEPEVRYWTVQMAGAIKYMHAKGIIHRDLKMGNIFLDHEMNVKVGDFGLAALFMSDKDWSACRRTTLCGTPNYIAPEILQKDKQGHDHAVDIWSLGIIIFAMLTGKPPFQSTTADEIYRKAREREYDWPDLETSPNHISEETKSLVAELLQTAEHRPSPDVIVQHPFFTCGYVPQTDEMTSELKENHPSSERFKTISRNGRSTLYQRSLKKLCMQCEVGPWSPVIKQPVSTYREVAAEEKAGLTPAVPLAAGVVYRRFDEWKEEQAKLLDESLDECRIVSVTEKKVATITPTLEEKLPMPLLSRPPTQSFAAQQRARPGTANPSSRGGGARQVSQDVAETNPRAQLSAPARQRLSTTKSSRNDRAPISATEDRLAVDLVNQLGSVREKIRPVTSEPLATEKLRVTTPIERPASSSQITKSGNTTNETSKSSQHSLFGPREKLDHLENSTPDQILQRLRKLLVEINRALRSDSLATSSSKQYQSPPVVVKWVDYTNRFGLGYILSNGDVGCVIKSLPANHSDASKGELPSGMLMIRDSELHVRSGKNENYPDRFQIVPINGSDIEFYEKRGDQGIFRGTVNPQNYKVVVDGAGKAVKLSRGTDPWDDRKRERIVVWKKFANYMTTFGRDLEYPNDPNSKAQEKKKSSSTNENIITFYQRFGDVGVWVYQEGHLQFNFPDHTKVVLSPDGVWCDFYHLSHEAARDLQTGTLKSRALDDRQRLSYPLQTLLNFSTPSLTSRGTTRKRNIIDPAIQQIPELNQFRLKIEFIKEVLNEWVFNGGIGNSEMSPEKRLAWMGLRETQGGESRYKHVWVTVGARNGDDRRVAWFNPLKPGERGPDIEK